MDNHQQSQGGPARHAKVAPAFVVQTLHRPISSCIGEVAPVELLRWRRNGDLTEAVRRELRQVIVERSRDRAKLLWGMSTGVRLVDGWRTALGQQDRLLVETLPLSQDRPLERWTLRQVTQALNVSLERALEILAGLESAYWEPSASITGSVGELINEQGPTVRVTPELRELAHRALRLPWLKRVARSDLRFAHDAPGGLPEWIPSQLRQVMVPAHFQRLLVRLVAAQDLTAEDEAREIVRAAAWQCAPSPCGAAVTQRWASVVLRRYLTRTGPGRTLAQVGQEAGFTRERVRQICDTFVQLVAHSGAVAPALERVLHAAARVAPAEASDLDGQLRRFIGDGAGIECLVPWAEALGVARPPVACERVRAPLCGQAIDVAVVDKPDAKPWVLAMIHHVHRDSQRFGCTSLRGVAGHLALEEGVLPGQEAIEGVLATATGFRWLDRRSGWFTVGDASACAAATQLRKIMAVGPDAIDTAEIIDALTRSGPLGHRDAATRGQATPPAHVLRKLFQGWPWLKAVHGGQFVAGKGFDDAGVLSEAEVAIARTIASHQGIACRFELDEVLAGRLGTRSGALTMLLGASPILARVEPGLYRLRGRRVGDDALRAARRRLREGGCAGAG